MNDDVGIIDRFLEVFSNYIDSGFGLLQGEVAFLTATLVVIDMTLAGLYWALGHATGHGEDVMAKLIRKVLYVGAFAYIIGNFSWLSSIVLRSFAGLGLAATGTMDMASLLQPGRLAKAGIDAGAPILEQVNQLTGFPDIFINSVPISVMLLAWLTVIVSFFVLAVQLFITLIEFKLTTLAGFVLVPFALWNKTAFLAEKVLGNVVSSGIKILVLAMIVGIGSGLFAQFPPAPAEPSIDHALVVMLASLSLLGLGIHGPGIATGLVSGAPQLGAGAMAGAALGATGTAVAVGAAATGVGTAVAAGARMAPTAVRATARVVRASTVAAQTGRTTFRTSALAAGGGARGSLSGMSSVARAAGEKAAAGARSLGQRAAAAMSRPPDDAATDAGAGADAGGGATSVRPTAPGREQPEWARRLHRRQQIGHAATTAAHTLRSGDGGGSGQGPDLSDSDT